jgi:formylglycine-generating enzyme required for sulfatase activity
VIDKNLGHYRIISSLGRGGMGEVWAAEDTKLGRTVALKILPEEMAQDPERRARFEREARAVAALDHPSIVTIHSIEEADGHHFITMQLVEGHTLADVVDSAAGEGVALEDFFDIAIPLAEAVSAAHGRSIAHRDLKPANVMITPDGRVLVLDFGLAKMLASSGDEEQTLGPGPTLTGEGKIMGTVAYMSPEQAEGRAIDERSDIFSLGVILYELSTGRRPFEGDTQMSILTSIIRDTPPPVSEIRETLPRHLGRLLGHCLEKSVDRRLQSATDLRNALEDLREELGGGSPNSATQAEASAATSVDIDAPGAGVSGGESTARRWLPAAIAVMLLAVAGGWWLSGSSARRERAETLDALTALAGEGRLDDVYQQLLASGMSLDDTDLQVLAGEFAGTLSFALEPAAATAVARRATPAETFDERAEPGQTLTSGGRLLAGEYVLRLAAPDHESVLRIVTVDPGAETVVDHVLLPTTDATTGMVRVDTGPSPLDAERTVAAFLIDARETTKSEYFEFIAAGGYRDATLWPEFMLIGDATLPSEEARATFVDRTGVPGPRGWSGGRYAEGSGDHPVTGISWHEAGAYARWRGKALPDLHQWWRAAVGNGTGIFPWGSDGRTAPWRANFEQPGTSPAGSLPLGASPFGALDMAGNVREWIRGPDQEPSLATGGSWQDPIYTFDPNFTEQFAPDAASDSIGLRLVAPLAPEA